MVTTFKWRGSYPNTYLSDFTFKVERSHNRIFWAEDVGGPFFVPFHKKQNVAAW